MEIIKEQFIPEVSQLISSRDYQEIIKEFKEKVEKMRDSVYVQYLTLDDSHFQENQLYNEKNATVQKIKIMIYVRDKFDSIGFEGKKYIINEIDKTLELASTNLKKNIGGLNTGLTMSVYTETDLDLIAANALDDFITYYDTKLDEFRKQAKDDETLTEVKED